MSAACELQSQREALAVEANHALATASPREILTWAIETFDDAFCITTSLADAVLVDMASQVRSGVHVLFVDTGYHFAETLRTRDELVRRYPINLVTAEPTRSVAEQDEALGRDLFGRNPNLCCQLRKVEPLDAALAPYSAWASGIRRDESSTRTDVGVVEWDAARAMVKVNPLARLSQEDVDDYIATRDVLVNPLAAQGYPSIGCAPCTRPVAEGEDARAGRWSGMAKTECGLHTR